MSEVWNPQLHQRKALRFILERPAAGLLLDPGLGKSSVMLAGLQIMQQKALVVAPLRVCYEVWPREAEKWSNFHDLKVVVLHGPRKEEVLEEDADLYCINPEGLEWLAPQWSTLDDTPKVLIVDESTRFKHAHTKRFKLLRDLLPSFHRRYILTGTPIPNGMIDLFGQVYILDLGASLGRFITHYRNTFFERSGFMGYDWTILPGAEERIYERLRPLALRLDAEDYLHLPPVITNTLMGQLPPKARAATTQLELTYMLELEGREVTAINAAALSIKLRQITGGFVYDPLGESHKIHEAKIEQLEDLLEEISGQPTLVAYQFDHEGQALAKRLSAPLLGEKTPKQVRELLEGWNRGEVPVLLVHPASAGHGLNLQAGGRHLIWYSLPWDQEHYDQLLRRLWRQGQTKPVYQHHLVMQDSVDELILTALSRKQKVQDEFLSHLKRGVKQWRSSRIVPVAELNSKATSSAIRAGNRRAPAASPSK